MKPSISPGTAGVVKVIDGQTVNGTATVYSQWYDASSGESFSVWALASSSAGNVDVNLFIDLSPLSEPISSSSTDTSKYVSLKLADAITTEGELQGPYTAANNSESKTYLDYPFMQWRIRVVGDGSNASDTVASVWVVRFN